jgi:tetratricopeptide (TPR) repeat protein
MGLVRYEKGEYDEAINDYENALNIRYLVFGENYPGDPAVYLNLGGAWQAKEEYDKAIDYYERALQIFQNDFGENHPNVAISYNNIAGIYYEKEEFDKAISYFEKALQIDLNIFGEDHPNVAIRNSNLGLAWGKKGEYDTAIVYHEKAATILLRFFDENNQIVLDEFAHISMAWYEKGEYDKAIWYSEKVLNLDLQIFGEDHPNVLLEYNFLGMIWNEKGGYDEAISYFEKCLKIIDNSIEPTLPNQETVAKKLSRVANSKGLELYREKRYLEALGYFQKALKNAQRAEDDAFSLTCWNNIGSMQKHLENYEEGLQSLYAGLHKAAQLNQELDQVIKDELTPEMLANPEVQNGIAELRNLPLIRRMQYHKVGCLKGLNRNEEADALAQQLWQEGIEANDTRLLDDLRKEGYDFGN